MSDRRLRRQLEARYLARVPPPARIQVHSSQELRADFNFQSAAVPGFDALFSELLAPARESVVRHVPVRSAGDEGADWTFIDLARALRTRGRVLVAVELRDAPGEVLVGPEDDEVDARWRLSELEAVWVVGPDAADDDGISADPTA